MLEVAWLLNGWARLTTSNTTEAEASSMQWCIGLCDQEGVFSNPRSLAASLFSCTVLLKIVSAGGFVGVLLDLGASSTPWEISWRLALLATVSFSKGSSAVLVFPIFQFLHRQSDRKGK